MVQKGKRSLAILLALVMVLSLLPATVFAGEGGRDETHIRQGQPLYYDEDGNEVDADGNWVVKTLKTAKTTGVENEFEITLEVEAKDRTQIVTTTEPVYADVVLVFDASTSMDDAMGKTTRWLVLKESANKFIDSFLGSGNTGNKVAIAIYGGSNKTNNPKEDYIIIQNFTSNPQTAKSSYNYNKVVGSGGLRAKYFGDTSTDYGATNCQAGYRGARDLFGSEDADNELKYLIYMSDGEANVSYSTRVQGNLICTKSHKHSDSCYNWTYTPALTGGNITTPYLNTYINPSDGKSNERFAAEAAVAQLADIKARHDVTVYAIGFGTAAANSYALSNPYTIYKEANDELVLEQTYNDISETINLASNPWKVSDLMGSNVIYKGLVSPNNHATFNNENKELSWDVGAQALENPANKKFTLKYYITLNMDNLDIWGKDEDGQYNFNWANGDTRLTYRIDIKDKDGNVTGTRYRIVDFDIPQVAADVYSITLEHYLDEATTPFSKETIKGHIGSDVLDLDGKIIRQAGRAYTHRDSFNVPEATVAFNTGNDGTIIKYYYTTGQALKIRYGYYDENSDFIPLIDDHDAVIKAGTAYSVKSPEIAGWHLEKSGDSTVSGTMPNKSLTLYVIYKQDNYNVTYRYEGVTPEGEVPPTDENTYLYDDTVTVKDEPVVGGWTFNGWKIGGEAVGNTFTIEGNTEVVGTWTIKQYNLDEIYFFEDDDDLDAYLAQLWDEEFEEYEEGVLGVFYKKYKGMDNVFLKSTGTHDYGYKYEFDPVTIDDFKTLLDSGANPGTLTANTIVKFKLVNDLFEVKVNHYKEVKPGTSGAIGKGGTFYVLEETLSAGHYNSGADYTIDARDYSGAGYGLNAEISDELTGHTMGEADVVHNLYYDIAKYEAQFNFVGSDVPDEITKPGDQESLWHGIDSVTRPTITVPDGWKFDGWYTDETMENLYDFSEKVTGDVQLYGKWTKLTYNVNFAFVGSVPEGSTVPATQTGMYYGDLVYEPDSSSYDTAYDTPSRDYTFLGWFKDSIGEVGYDFDNGVINSHTVYGKWEVSSIKYPFTVEHYVDGVLKITEPGGENLDHGYVIDNTAAQAYKIDTSDSRFTDALGHNYIGFDKATGVTISEVEANNVVKCYYKTKEYNLTIHYVYVEDDSPVGPSHTSKVVYGKDYGVVSPDKPYYSVELRSNAHSATLTGLTVSGTMPARDVELTVIYSPFAKYKYHIDYYWIDPTTGEEVPLWAQYASNGIYEGDTYSISGTLTSGKVIEDYTYERTVGSTSGTMTEDVYVKVYFTRDTAALKVRHVDDSDESGTGSVSQALAGSNRDETLYAGGAYEANSAPLPANYKLVSIDYPQGAEREGDTITGNLGGKGSETTIVYHYAPLKSATVRVEYWLVNDEGVKLGDALNVKSHALKEGQNYDVSGDQADTYGNDNQYRFVGDNVDGIYSGGPLAADQSVTIELYYTLNDYAFTVKYVNGRTGQAIGEPREGSALYGTVMTNSKVGELLEDEGWVNARRPSGYNDGQLSATITIGSDLEKNVIIVTYNRSGGGGKPPTTPTEKEPEVIIPDEDVPAGPAPVEPDDEGVVEDENIIIDEEETPLGKLPQTGTMAGSQTTGWMYAILIGTMTGAGLITTRRRREEQ